MSYIATLTRNNQITVPRSVREILGVKAGGKIVFNVTRRDAVMVERQKNVEEVAEEIHALFPAEVRENFRETAGQTAGEFRENWLSSDAAKEYYDGGHNE